MSWAFGAVDRPDQTGPQYNGRLVTDIALPARVVRRLWDHVLTALPRLVDWLTVGGFERAVEASVRHRFRAGRPTETEITRYLESLNAPDLALATACLGGSEEAWSHVMLELRPGLYRAARALTRDEAAGRQLADALWTELYGVGTTKNSVEPGTEARPLLVYYHGRSALATWLHSVLAQRHVDSVRRTRRLEPLDTGDAVPEPTTAREPVDPDRAPLRQAFEGALDTRSASSPPTTGCAWRCTTRKGCGWPRLDGSPASTRPRSRGRCRGFGHSSGDRSSGHCQRPTASTSVRPRPATGTPSTRVRSTSRPPSGKRSRRNSSCKKS